VRTSCTTGAARDDRTDSLGARAPALPPSGSDRPAAGLRPAQNPSEVKVSRPSDALAAKLATGKAFTGLLLGLGAVALLVGVANTMVISVLERRAEIGLRRSLGATRGQIRTQFLAESLLLSALGGIGGALLGIGATTTHALYQNWPTVVPLWAITGGIAATLVIGALAGLYPAIRASRLSRGPGGSRGKNNADLAG
jgi:putative ABC transport system permease protein